jgi:hypothetical protein
MSQKQKESIQKFIPSSGQESYLIDAPEQWVQVNTLWSKARASAYEAVTTFVQMGELLLIMRDSMPGDLEFGKARKKYAPDLSRNDAFRAMNMARNKERFLIAPNTPVPSISVFAELVNASDELVEEILTETAETGKSPKVREVRERVKAEQPESAEDFESEVSTRDEPLPDVEQEDTSPQPVLLDYFNMTVTARIKALKIRVLDMEKAHLVLGLNPYYDGDQPMVLDLFIMISHDYMDRIEANEFTQKDAKMIEDSLDFIRETCYG